MSLGLRLTPQNELRKIISFYICLTKHLYNSITLDFQYDTFNASLSRFARVFFQTCHFTMDIPTLGYTTV